MKKLCCILISFLFLFFPLQVSASQQDLIDSTIVNKVYYGSTQISLEGKKGSYGTVSISKDTYKFKINQSKTKIKLKKVYPLNTKAKFTVYYGKTKISFTEKFEAATFILKATGSNKTLNLRVYNPHKNDKITVKYKNKTYTKKITNNNKDGKDYSFTMKLKDKIKKGNTITVTITNKDKKTLDKLHCKLPYNPFGY